MKNPFRKTTYHDFESGMLVIATPPKKSVIRSRIFVVKSVTTFNGKVKSLYIKNIASRSITKGMRCFPAQQITAQINNPKEYFQGMKLKIIK